MNISFRVNETFAFGRFAWYGAPVNCIEGRLLIGWKHVESRPWRHQRCETIYMSGDAFNKHFSFERTLVRVTTNKCDKYEDRQKERDTSF